MVKTRLVNMLLLLATLAGILVVFASLFPRFSRLGSSTRILSTPELLKEVQTLAQLVTVKYVMEKVVIVEDVQPLKDMIIQGWGDNRLLMVAHGIVKAGVDLAEIKPGDIQVSQKSITIKIPPSRVTDCYLDDKFTEVVDRKTGLLRSFDKDLEQNARRQAVAEINLSARKGGILKDSDERARAQLTSLFRQMGFERVEFR